MVLILQLYRYVIKVVYLLRIEYGISFSNKFIFWYTDWVKGILYSVQCTLYSIQYNTIYSITIHIIAVIAKTTARKYSPRTLR